MRLSNLSQIWQDLKPRDKLDWTLLVCIVLSIINLLFPVFFS